MCQANNSCIRCVIVNAPGLAVYGRLQVIAFRRSGALFAAGGKALDEIDYPSLLPKLRRIYNFSGKKERFDPVCMSRVLKGEIAPRSAKMFVSLVNAVQCWEIVKNVAEMNNLPLSYTSVVRFPEIQIFDPFKGSACYFNAQTYKIGIPNWLTDEIAWHDI